MQVSSYLSRQMDRYPVPSQEEQLDLIRKAQDGCEESRDLLILGNLRLIRMIAQEVGVPSHYSMDDLISEGVQGLSYSINKFDFNEGVKPSTFFWNAIKWKMIKFKELIGPDHLSLNATYETEEDDEQEFIDLVEDPAALNLNREMEAYTDLKRLLRYLPEQEQIIMILYYGLFGFESYGLDEIGSLLGLTHARIWQAQQRALRKMQELPVIPPTNDLISNSDLQKLIDSGNILSKREKVFNRESDKLNIEIVEHSYTFARRKKVPEFLEEFGDRIRSDYEAGASIRTLAIKYNCPRTQITKAIRG